MPWRCRGGDYDVEQEENKNIPSKLTVAPPETTAAETEVDDLGKKIFQMAADKSPTVITKSPQPNNSCQIINKTFDDIITASIER